MGGVRGVGGRQLQLLKAELVFYPEDIIKTWYRQVTKLHTDSKGTDWHGHMGLMAILWFPQHFPIREF